MNFWKIMEIMKIIDLWTRDYGHGINVTVSDKTGTVSDKTGTVSDKGQGQGQGQ